MAARGAILAGMSDVVEQGRRDRWVPPRWLRGSAIAGALAIGAFVVTQPHLLSADKPAAHRPPPALKAKQPPPLPLGDNTSQDISIVVRQGDHLERYEAGSGVRRLATLPAGLRYPASLVFTPGTNGSGPLVGVENNQLFRVSPVRGRTVKPVASAARVLGLAPRPGRLFALEPAAAHHRQPVVELDAVTGDITNHRPFPGYDDAGLWRPAAVVSLQSRRALVLFRPADGGRLDLALAWDRVRAGLTDASPFVRIGSTSQLLSVVGTRILTIDNRPDICIDRGCPVTVLTVTGDGILVRSVQPPRGWIFRTPVAGAESGDPLMVVSQVDDPARLALARLFGGGRLGLLVAGTDGLVPSVAPVGGPAGSVLFAVPRPEGSRLSVLLRGADSAALLVDLPALAPGSELVCACR
jgi:hypothetical protein